MKKGFCIFRLYAYPLFNTYQRKIGFEDQISGPWTVVR